MFVADQRLSRMRPRAQYAAIAAATGGFSGAILSLCPRPEQAIEELRAQPPRCQRRLRSQDGARRAPAAEDRIQRLRFPSASKESSLSVSFFWTTPLIALSSVPTASMSLPIRTSGSTGNSMRFSTSRSSTNVSWNGSRDAVPVYSASTSSGAGFPTRRQTSQALDPGTRCMCCQD